MSSSRILFWLWWWSLYLEQKCLPSQVFWSQRSSILVKTFLLNFVLESWWYLDKLFNPNRLFKLQEKENGDIVLHSLFLRRNTDEDRYSYPTFSLDLLRCQVFELAQEHVACYSEWSEPCEGKVERRIGFMSLDAESNEFMVLGRLPFKGPAVYRSIDGRWTELQITQPVSFEGIVSYKSKFYAIDLTGRTIVVEPTLQLHTFQRSRPSYKARKRWVRRLKTFISLLGLLSFLETWVAN